MAQAGRDSSHSTPLARLRPLQKAIKTAQARMQVAAVHRRYGKTFGAADWLIDAAERCEHPNPRCYFVFPYARQAEEVTWDMFKALLGQEEYTKSSKDEDAILMDEWRLEIRLPKREQDSVRPLIKLLGAQEYHKHRGKYADAVAFDETVDIPPPAWTQVFRPMLSDRDGRALFIGTPRGKDWFYDLWRNAATLPGWAQYHATVYETGVLPDAEIAALEREVPEHEFAQEYLCDWDRPAPGAFFQRQINAMLDTHRIGVVPHLPDASVIASWHLHKSIDTSTVLFWQRSGAMVHCFDAEQVQAQSFTDLCEIVAGKPYVYSQHLAAPDMKDDSWRLRTARKLGLKLRPVRPFEVMDGIDRARAMMPRMRISNGSAGDLVEACRSYHASYDEKKRVYREPVLDWSASWADALMTFCQGYNENRSDWSKPIPYRGRQRA